MAEAGPTPSISFWIKPDRHFAVNVSDSRHDCPLFTSYNDGNDYCHKQYEKHHRSPRVDKICASFSGMEQKERVERDQRYHRPVDKISCNQMQVVVQQKEKRHLKHNDFRSKNRWSIVYVTNNDATWVTILDDAQPTSRQYRCMGKKILASSM